MSVLLTGSILLASCGPGGTGAPTASPSAAPASGPVTYDIQLDAKTAALNLQADAFFPNALRARPGDTLRFKAVDRGVAHTVTFGTMVDAAVASIPRLSARPQFGAATALTPELARLPVFVGPPPARVVSQAATRPCFVASGEPPADPRTACPPEQQTSAPFDGTQTFFNSGWLVPDQPYTLKLATAMKPGTYSFLCLLHLDAMTGQVTVVDPGQAADTPDQVKANAEKQLTDSVGKLKASLDASATTPAERAVAGVVALPDVRNAMAAVFAPKEISIPVGGAVTWTIFGPHTISLNAPQDAVGPFLRAADGTVSANLKAFNPTGGPGQPPPPAAGAPPPPAGPILIDAGTWDGRGFLSSGVVRSNPPTVFAYKITFTEAGTYPFRCVIHPDMEGTVRVGK